jgi:hypothetical protein
MAYWLDSATDGIILTTSFLNISPEEWLAEFHKTSKHNKIRPAFKTHYSRYTDYSDVYGKSNANADATMCASADAKQRAEVDWLKSPWAPKKRSTDAHTNADTCTDIRVPMAEPTPEPMSEPTPEPTPECRRAEQPEGAREITIVRYDASDCSVIAVSKYRTF